MALPSRNKLTPTHNTYGGIIYFKNTSSYNQYWEIDIIDKSKGGFYFDRISLEINDVIIHSHIFYVLFSDDNKFDRNSIDPNNYFRTIRIYDMNTGILLKEFHTGDKIFVLTTGNLESGIWDVDITDSCLTGSI